eukprot:TRINITY_DN5_c0_g1_i1.p1 TRINITY_DN5_c0_g1~~TRINITY_DN5_c0_g1_i1.p1  ORF type:complete len:254 (+),score=47.22 TRINITY_DN5_c0_g1_i1:106-762(+)
MNGYAFSLYNYGTGSLYVPPMTHIEKTFCTKLMHHVGVAENGAFAGFTANMPQDFADWALENAMAQAMTGKMEYSEFPASCGSNPLNVLPTTCSFEFYKQCRENALRNGEIEFGGGAGAMMFNLQTEDPEGRGYCITDYEEFYGVGKTVDEILHSGNLDFTLEPSEPKFPSTVAGLTVYACGAKSIAPGRAGPVFATILRARLVQSPQCSCGNQLNCI